MRKRTVLFCVFAVAAASLQLWTCSKKDNPTGSGDGGGITNQSQTVDYTVAGNDIIISVPQEIYTSSYCDIDSLTTYSDTTPAQNQTLPFVLDGNTLKFVSGPDTEVFVRVGIGSGLQGQWSLSDTGLQGGEVMFYFTANTLTVTETFVNCYADDWMSWDWASDSAYYNVTATKVSCTQVTLTGNVTQEKVTITWNSNGDMTFTSTNSGHAAYTYYENPASCPDNYEPDWYYSGFLLDNNYSYAPPAKRAVRHAVPRIRKHQKFPLFR